MIAMRIVTLYRYKTDSGVVVSPIEPTCEYTTLVRVIADEGKVITDGDTIASCIDTETADGWAEIEMPIE